ncbi:MAG: oligosaccharide flippase family protein [Rhizobiaceae bacterium]|nr:oligosaccharide flippase family protein [Rhizobiaceae bacterium]
MLLKFEKGTAGWNGFAKSVGALISANIVAQLVMLAATPLTTRLYTPADFGAFAVFTGLFSVAFVVSSLRYELAVPLPRSEGNAFGVMLLALLINSVVALALVPVVALWRERASEFFNVPELAHILWILPLSIVGAGSYRAFRMWSVRRRDFGAIARTRVTQSVAMVAAQIMCGFAGLGGLGLAIGHSVGQTSGAYRLAAGTREHFDAMKRTRRARMLSLARRYSRFPKFDVAAATLDAVSVQLPNLLLALLFTPAIAGFYMVGERVLGVPLSLLSQSIGQVLYSHSRNAVEGGQISVLATRVLMFLAALLALPTLLMFLAGEPIFEFVFGDAWREAGMFASWLMVGLFGQVLFSSISLVLMATSAQNINFMIHAVMLVLKGAALLLGYVYGSALTAIVALSLVNLVGYLFACAVIIRHTRGHDAGTSAQLLLGAED